MRKVSLIIFLMTSLLAGATESIDSVLALSEVSVTAIKQGERLDAQPVASTMITSREIEKYNIVTMKQVSEVSPNLYIPDYGSRMTSSIYMRGIGARIDQPAVGLNVDNVPFLNKDNYDFDLLDIERVEVLRGPQSALYGRNTMAGLINIYTLSPFQYQGVRFFGEYGSGEAAKLGASVYNRFGQNLGMSLAGYYTRQEGFFRNAYNNSHLDRERQGSIRWRTAWRPAGQVSVDNVAAITLSRQGGYPYQSVSTGQISYNDTCFYRRTGFTDGLTVKFDRGGWYMSSITSFQYINDNMTLDQDFTPEKYFTLTQRRHEWAITHDFIARGGSGVYKWMGGVFGFFKRYNMSAPVNFGPTGIERLITAYYNEHNPYYPIVWGQDNFLLGSEFVAPTWGLAAYHESVLTLDRWTMTLGTRIDMDHTQLDYRSSCDASYVIYDATVDPHVFYREVPVTINDGGSLHKTSLQLLPKYTLSYRYGATPDDNAYLSIAKGYKAGGYNTQMFSDVLQQRVMETMGIMMKYDVDQIVSYDPEKSWNFEIGAHYHLLNNRLLMSAALFYIHCRDQQLTMFPPGTITGRIMTNAGKTRSSGLEASVAYAPSDRWMLRASYGLTLAKFVEFDNGKQDFAGKRVPYAPSNTLFLSVTYGQPVALSWLDRVSATVSTRGVGDIYWDEANTVCQPFYALLDASITLQWRDYSIDFWGNNLTGTKYSTFYFVSMNNSFLQQGRPRSLGATLRLNFSAN